MKLLCVACEIELKCEHTGVRVAETMQNGTALYKIWSADKYKCPNCGIEVVSGFAQYPLFEHFDKEIGTIDQVLEKMKEQGFEIIYDHEHYKKGE